jgi:hypothetical protein|tara:strand:- start:3585 stop:4985 length:1401 start_codon:yes stop_codon:yes gene_type:complete
MRTLENYTAINKFPIFKGYIEHFGNTSIDNDIPGMLSFFFVQGQIAVPYVRIPWGSSHLDPRVHTFWIQSSRTGKSIAWEFVGDVLRDINVPTDLYTTGTDAGLIGGYEESTDSDGIKENILKEGFLNGRKALNFDEGSIILNPNKHSQETVLYLQSACNPVGSNNNVLVKHTKAGRIETESLVSLWITTYPPAGVKEYVLTKGIFQRVLLYWSNWTMERRMNVSHIRAESAFKKTPKTKISYDEVTNYFMTLEKRLRDKVLDVTETPFVEWDSMSRATQEDLLQESMTEIFSATADFYPAMFDAIEEYYELLIGLGPGISEVVASFIPAMENYTVIFATHMAMMDETWKVNGDHVDMSKEILYDLFKNLIQWLEGEVEIGPKVAERATQRNKWIVAFQQVEPVELGNRGDGWRKKGSIMSTYMTQNGVTRGTAFNHFSKWAKNIFDTAKDGKVVYLRLKEEILND